MAVTGAFPYDLNNLLGGRARVLISDDAGALPAVPANIKDVFDPISPYTAETGWLDVGATAESTDYTRNLETSGWEIEQSTAAVFEEPTDSPRTIKVAMAEFKPEFIKVMEEAPAVGTVAAVTGAMAQKSVKVGSITTLTNRRVAFVAMRNKGSGTVTETGAGVIRGRYVMFAAYQATIAADASQVQVAKGQLTSAPVTFSLKPQDGQPSGQEHGIWLMEDAGVMT
jgi:hypothetical protein